MEYEDGKFIEQTQEMQFEDDKFNQLIDHFISKEGLKLANLQADADNFEINKESLIETAKIVINEIVGKNKKVANNLIERFKSYMWGYYVIKPLLNDKDISDIKILSYKNITYKKAGKRYKSDLKFKNPSDYNRFVNMICTRNKKNMSVIKAQVKFSDSLSNDLFRLRFNLSSGYINTSGIPSVHIRTIPKVKVTLNKLVKKGYMNETQKEYLTRKFKEGESIIFIGANASGKTTGVNALLEEFPKNKSGLIIQETDELFLDNHDMVNVQHTVEGTTDGDAAHSLFELANVGLMDDDDMFVLGEVKSGEDAGALPAIISTGSQVLLTGHGNNEREGIFKLADYVKQATGYTMDQCLKFFAGINIVCYIEKYKIKSMSRIGGWDYDNDKLIMYKLNDDCEIENKQDYFHVENASIHKDVGTEIKGFVMSVGTIEEGA